MDEGIIRKRESFTFCRHQLFHFLHLLVVRQGEDADEGDDEHADGQEGVGALEAHGGVLGPSFTQKIFVSQSYSGWVSSRGSPLRVQGFSMAEM